MEGSRVDGAGVREVTVKGKVAVGEIALVLVLVVEVEVEAEVGLLGVNADPPPPLRRATNERHSASYDTSK